jgi:cobalt/nickel transport protein
MKTISKLWILIAILAVLSPIGLILPELFKAGAAWGEWAPGEVRGLIGYIPQGMARLSSLWSAPIPDYAFKGWEGKALPHLSFAYIMSSAAGIVLTIAAIFVIGKLLSRKNDLGSRKK